MHLKLISVQDQDKILTFTQEQYSIAAAIAVASAIPLPGQAVEDPTAYFDGAYAGSKELLGTLNEVRPFNLEDAAALVRGYWLGRYASVHSPLMERADRAMPSCDSLASIFGYAFYLSQDQLCKIETHKAAVAQLLPVTFKAAAAFESTKGE